MVRLVRDNIMEFTQALRDPFDRRPKPRPFVVEALEKFSECGVPRFGGALNLHIHIHALVTDGGFVPAEGGRHLVLHGRIFFGHARLQRVRHLVRHHHRQALLGPGQGKYPGIDRHAPARSAGLHDRTFYIIVDIDKVELPGGPKNEAIPVLCCDLSAADRRGRARGAARRENPAGAGPRRDPGAGLETERRRGRPGRQGPAGLPDHKGQLSLARRILQGP
ncbi:MAG TPA: hypothetical protein DDW67_01115 [Elusimicrobia bacterium]|nr:hypothetical protein [Elusimicrobiota bacterium]